jgi:predicted lysophospholipase L1 biosynthesis ABC-type transport system permease subunit
VDSAILWRVAVVQLVAVAVLSIVLGLALPHSFFADWGWLVGPGAWALCAWFTARVVGLPVWPVLIGAALAGVVSLLFVVAGLHWLGAVVAVGLFAAWCSRLPRPLAGPTP